MAKYIKTHSNYRLSSKSQETNNGTILERDISTVGGVDSFSSSQATIYKTGNFVITINNEATPSRHIVKAGWVSNTESGDTWNEEVLENYTSDINGSVESTISMKNDFMDLRSFAYYGSLYNLIQTSVNDIIEKFPYEIYTGYGNGEIKEHYISLSVDKSTFTYTGDVESNSPSISETGTFYDIISATPVSYFSGYTEDLYETYNPASIDMHTVYIDDITIDNELRYFANEGYLNYEIINDTTGDSGSEEKSFTWNVVKLNEFYLDDVLRQETKIFFPKSTKLDAYAYTHYVLNVTKDVVITAVNNGEILFSGLNIKASNGDILYFRVKNKQLEFSKTYCPQVGDYLATITLSVSSAETYTFIAAIDEDLNIQYLTPKSGLLMHIRPKESLSFYDNYIASLDMFEKCLMGVFSGVKNTAKFEILEESERGTNTSLKTFVFPSGKGDYNVATEGMPLQKYVQDLAQIGLNYDNNYTDNIYRMMTHESLKNLDWTRNFNGSDSYEDETEYQTIGQKFKSIIDIIGYAFDKEKSYIDCIGNTNTITYNNRSNLPDYFLSDSLDTDGWDVHKIYPFDLKEYSKKTGKEIKNEYWTDDSQSGNFYLRKFGEMTADIISPYSYDEGGWYMACVSGNPEEIEIDVEKGKNYYLADGTVYNVIRNYQDDTEYTIPDINNNFLKRLRLNSKQILRKKGTVDGVESILSMFGMKSKAWYDSINTNRTQGKFEKKFTKNIEDKLPYDYDINEYTVFAAPISETWDSSQNMYKIDYYNTCKTVAYNTQSYINGVYIQYQGLPVSYRDLEDSYIAKTYDETTQTTTFYDTTDATDTNICLDSDGLMVNSRKLYPDFESEGIYDGGMYYQMNGGWVNYWPYRYNPDNDLMANDNEKLNLETFRTVRQVQTLDKLLSCSPSDIYDGVIFYVNNLTTDYAIVDGMLYELLSETDSDGNEYEYFKVIVQNNSVSIGFNLFTENIEVSNPLSDDNKKTYTLQALDDGYIIKIYYLPEETNPFIIRGFSFEDVEASDDETEDPSDIYPTFVQVFKNESYGGEEGKYTHYFKLKSTLSRYLIAGDGWSQLTTDDEDYLRISAIIDNYIGNNPHSGGDGYDNGHEYLSRFTKLFKYPVEQELFDTDCFLNPSEELNKIYQIGFSGLTNTDTELTDYSMYLHPDKKVHCFCDKLDTCGSCGDIIGKKTTYYKTEDGYVKKSIDIVNHAYDMDDSKSISSINTYSFVSGVTNADGVTSQIVNTKVMEIKFFLKNENFYSKECQEEVKYIEDVIMPYVEQVLPSTIIPKVKLYVHPFNWVFEDGTWDDDSYWNGDETWVFDDTSSTEGSSGDDTKYNGDLEDVL